MKNEEPDLKHEFRNAGLPLWSYYRGARFKTPGGIRTEARKLKLLVVSLFVGVLLLAACAGVQA